jgi:hypothetical protein
VTNATRPPAIPKRKTARRLLGLPLVSPQLAIGFSISIDASLRLGVGLTAAPASGRICEPYLLPEKKYLQISKEKLSVK